MSDTGRKVRYCAKPVLSPHLQSPSKRDLFPSLSPVSNPIANLFLCDEMQACGLSMCQAVNGLVMQDGLADDLYSYINLHRTVRRRLSSLLPSSLLISRKSFHIQCPIKMAQSATANSLHRALGYIPGESPFVLRRLFATDHLLTLIITL